MISRREAMTYIGSIPFLLQTQLLSGCDSHDSQKPFPDQKRAKIWKASDSNPKQLTERLIAGFGGVDNLFDKDDIIILKVNSQWWNQGMTNTDILESFISNILNMPGFTGEIIIADNHQSKEPNSRGWTTEMRNGRFNYNELIQYFQNMGHPNVTKYHWHPAGPNPTPLQLDGQGDAVITHPSEGDGYIWPQDLYYECPFGNRTVLAYPVFTSSFSGTTIDLKNGAFRNGKYTDQPIKFINCSALNHHSCYAGVTASIKNYMGVVDMSCGYPAPYPEGTYNTHHVGSSQVFRFLAKHQKRLADVPFFWDICLAPTVFRFRYTGGVLGKFMKSIRSADMHIITAVNVGWGSRTDVKMASPTNTLVASTDPVALDYWASVNILTKATKEAGGSEYFQNLNDPSLESNPFRAFLYECRREFGGTIDPELMDITEC
jgi:hypothetical protein